MSFETQALYVCSLPSGKNQSLSMPGRGVLLLDRLQDAQMQQTKPQGHAFKMYFSLKFKNMAEIVRNIINTA